MDITTSSGKKILEIGKLDLWFVALSDLDSKNEITEKVKIKSFELLPLIVETSSSHNMSKLLL